jgi:hypothetical protein
MSNLLDGVLEKLRLVFWHTDDSFPPLIKIVRPGNLNVNNKLHRSSKNAARSFCSHGGCRI